MEKEQKNALAERANEQKKQFEEILAQVKKEKFTGYGYSDDTEVTISGKLFSSFLSYLQMNQNHYTQMQNTYEQLMLATDVMIVESTDTLIEFFKQHLDNCKNGVAIPEKELEKTKSEQKINPIIN